MLSVITYFTGGIKYSVPNELWFTYSLVLGRFIFASYVISYYFLVPYSVLTLAITVLLADFRFYIDFQEYMEFLLDNPDDEEKF